LTNLKDFYPREATKRRIEGFVESVAQEVASFGIGITIIEPGGARTEFRYGGARVAKLMPIYDQTPAHSFLRMLDPKNGVAAGDPERMAARIIESVEPASKHRPNAPLRRTFRPRRDIYGIFLPKTTTC